jgi:hypothetical protein
MMIKHIKKLFSFTLLLFATTLTNASAPSWNLNEAAFTNIMTITGIVTISGTELTNSNDMVAAFVGTECRGLTHLLPSTTLNHSFAYLMIMSNTQGETVHFKIYRSAGDSIIDITDTRVFTSDQMLGNQELPYLFSNENVNATAILSLSLGIAGETTNIDNATNVITVTVPLGTDVTSIIPDVVSSLGSQSEIAGKTISDTTVVNLSTEVIVTIIAQDGTTSNWTIKVVYNTVPLTFSLTNGTIPVVGATVSIIGYSDIVTDAKGEATFNVVPQSDVVFTIKASGQKDTTATLIVANQSQIQAINYSTITNRYSVSFVIKDGSTLLVGAKVTLDGYSELTSNTLGKVTFTNVTANQNLAFIIKATGYADSVGTIVLQAKDTLVTIQSQLIGYKVVFVVKNSFGVISDAKVTLVGYGDKISDALGMVTFPNVKPQNMVSFGINAQGYIDSVATFTMISADVMKTIILKEIPTAIKIEEIKNMVVYPNPCKNQLTIQLPPNSNRFRIIDSKGQLKYELMSQINQELNTEILPVGIYFITSYSIDGKSITQSIIKE